MYLKQQTKKVVAVDLDQTLAHTLDSLVLWHNDMYGSGLRVTDFNTLDYWKVWGGSKEESCYKMRQFYASSYFDQVQPIDDFALEALKMLKRRHFQLVIITSRQQYVAEKTKRFVDKHYPGIFESIYFCNLNLSDSEQLEYVSKSKSVICQEIGVDVLIDDCLEHALDVSALGVDVLLYDRKGDYNWNHLPVDIVNKHTLTSTSQRLYQHHHTSKELLSNNIQRVLSWRDIIAQFPKPSSPLKYCYYPENFDEEEEESIEDNEDDDLFDPPPCPVYTYGGYETVEVEMSDDEEQDEYWKDNRVYVN